MYHPLFCQQLGFFYKNEKKITQDFIYLFHDKILRSYFKNFTYNSTSEFFILSKKTLSENLINDISVIKRNNFQLNLNRSYKEIIKGYNKILLNLKNRIIILKYIP